MSDPFLGEIRMFGGNFAPTGWALCNGQLLSISQNTALFSLLGTTFGGDGQTNFALPNLQGRVAVHFGQGAGLSPYTLGQQGGSEQITLTINQTPAHSHAATITVAGSAHADAHSPAGAVLGGGPGRDVYASSGPDGSTVMNAHMATASVAMAGGNLPHPNIQPYTCVNFIIALQGIYPSRS